MPSSSSSRGLLAPRAHLLKPGKLPTGRRNPVIVYLQPPKVIHTNAKNFRSLVQRLTGKGSCHCPAPSTKSSGEDSGQSPNFVRGNEGWRSFRELMDMEDPLLLTLGKS
ncbi:hypothetical protein KFK09_016241 [Dendrobium nobile]|uniref:VQ domain-containing protein n=1 Tax=Dendrobium nobile TaxID=94219 RepID=A0A8T3AYU1_DENNO|nr:hypothetical protein KFK09_016241 [Dendrobium nobile]